MARGEKDSEEKTLQRQLSRFPTIRWVRPLFAGLMQAGFDPMVTLRKARIDPAAVAAGTDRVSPDALCRVFAIAAAQAGPDVGLRASEVVDYRMFRNLGGSAEYLFLEGVLSRPNVNEALAFLQHYSPISFGGGGGGYRLSRTTGGVDVTFGMEPGRKIPPALAEYFAAWVVRALRQCTEHPLASASFRFRHAAPPTPALARYERVLGSELSFEEETDGFWFSDADLAVPLRGYQPAVAAVISQRADEALALYSEVPALVEQVRGLVGRALGRRNFDAASIASELGISARTLSRRLQAEGSSYQGLLDEERAKVAERLLEKEGLSVAACAERLGFSDASTFHRAYRRWFGKAPSGSRPKKEPRGAGRR